MNDVSNGGASPLMTAIYSIHYFDDRSLLDEALAHQRSYPATLVCDTDLPWIADGLIRDSEAVRARCQALLRTALHEARITYTLVSGDLATRLAIAHARLAQLDPISSAPR